MIEPLLSSNDLLELLGCTKKTLLKALRSGKLPPPCRVLGHPRWRRADVEAALERSRQPA